MKMLKRKNRLIEYNISRNINPPDIWLKTFEAFVTRAVDKKHTSGGSKEEFVIIIRSEIGPASTAKHTERIIIRRFF
jgi:hypothetical protein